MKNKMIMIMMGGSHDVIRKALPQNLLRTVVPNLFRPVKQQWVSQRPVP
jgi:DNA polymerase II small subunit/DNA polymerase delta subunit B